MRAISTGTAPLDPLRAHAAIEDAFDRDEIFELLVRAARARLPFVALLTVHPDQLRGWRVMAEPAYPTEGVATLQLSRNVAALEAAIASRSPAIAKLATGEEFVDGLLELLGGAAANAAVLPVTLRGRPLGLIVAHRGGGTVAANEIADLFPLLDAADAALARVLSVRARSAAERAPTRADSTEYELEVSYDQRREALAGQRAAGAWAEAAETIRELVRDGVDRGDPGEDEQLELLLELGGIEAERLGRPEAAIEAWRSALAIDGGDPRVLDALEALLAKLGRWRECVELLDKRVALTEAAGPRIALLLNLGAIAREHLGDPATAIEAYERVVGIEAGHAVAAAQLEELYRAQKEWQPLAAQMLDRASREADAEASIAALEEVAETYEHKVGDPRAALLVWLTIARRAPERTGVVEEIGRLAGIAGEWDEVGAAAEAIEAAHPHAAAALWLRVGRAARDHHADRDGAVRAFERALRLGLGDGERESELMADLGELHEALPALAIEYYERALAARPEALPVLVALHRLYLADGAWAPLAEILPRLIDALAPSADVAVIVDLHVELGTICADRLDRPDDAARTFHDALALDPRKAAAHRGLAQVLEATGQAEALLDARELELEASPAAEQIRGWGDLAAAWHEHGKLDRAAAVWNRLLGLEPKSAVAQQGLARTLRAAGQWLELADALRAQIALAPGGADRLVLLELAELLEGKVGDDAGAIAALEQVIAGAPDDPPALDALARLYDRAGRLRPALDALNRLLAVTQDPHARADLLQRVAQVHLAARDAAAARLVLVQSLALDRENARAREAMARVHLQQGELVAAGEELRRAARLATEHGDTVRCLADAAWLYRHRLGDTERARECLHQILELEPAHADAKQALAELLHDNQEWASLWPHLEQQVARAKADAALPAPERAEVYTMAARCAVELGKFPAALELYDLACAAQPGAATLIERAEALYRSKALDAAALSYQTIATGSAALDRAQRVAVFRRLAQIHTELGKAAQAQQWHGKVLDLDADHTDTLTDLAELHLAGGRYDDAIASLRALAQHAQLADKVGLLERIGDLYRDQLANPARATSTYLDALELDRGNRRVLQRLLDLQTAAGQWTRAVETIDKFLEHETDPARRAAYHLAAAEIRRTELRDTPGALTGYERALDDLFATAPLTSAARQRGITVFQQIDTVLTEERDWKTLEQAYRRMIKRVPPGDPVLVVLWHALGELYRTRLELVQSAIQAFEVAHQLDPDKSAARTRVLAQLYAKIGAAQPQVATMAAKKLVEADPDASGAYRLVGSASRDAGKVDEAWCAARALVVLKRASFDEELLYRKYQPHEAKKATGILDEDAWQYVRSRDEDRVVSAIFALVWESLVALRAGSPKSFELRAKDKLAIADDTRVVAKIFRHAARVLNVALPDVYAQPRRPGSLMLANCIEKGRLAPAVIVGRDMMTGYRDTEIAAAVGAMLAQLRPAYYLRLALATVEELEAAVAAAAKLCGRTVGRTELAPLVEVFAPAIAERLTRPTAEALAALVERLPERPDLAKWRAAVDATAQRCGLLVAGELAAAARMTGLGGPRQRVQDLIAYSVSAEYFAVRQHLGVAVKRA